MLAHLFMSAPISSQRAAAAAAAASTSPNLREEWWRKMPRGFYTVCSQFYAKLVRRFTSFKNIVPARRLSSHLFGTPLSWSHLFSARPTRAFFAVINAVPRSIVVKEFSAQPHLPPITSRRPRLEMASTAAAHQFAAVGAQFKCVNPRRAHYLFPRRVAEWEGQKKKNN